MEVRGSTVQRVGFEPSQCSGSFTIVELAHAVDITHHPSVSGSMIHEARIVRGFWFYRHIPRQVGAASSRTMSSSSPAAPSESSRDSPSSRSSSPRPFGGPWQPSKAASRCCCSEPSWWGIGLRGVAGVVAGLLTATGASLALFIGTLAVYGLVHGALELGAVRYYRRTEGFACIVLSVIVVWIYTHEDLESDPTPELVVLVLFCVIIAAADVAEAWRRRGVGDRAVQQRALVLCGVAWALFGVVIAVGISGLLDLDTEARVGRLEIIGTLAAVCGIARLGLAWWLRSDAKVARRGRDP